MQRGTLVTVSIFVIAALLFFWVQARIVDLREDYRIEEKILMLSDDPDVTKMLALGFDNAMADLMWLRAIQYFGGNFSTLEDPDKREGMVNLFRNIVGLDPRWIDAWQFGGFVFNEAVRDPSLAIDFLLEGSRKNPEAWKLPFDAGFILFYQLEDYEGAKELFIRSAYGPNLLQSDELTPSFSAQGMAGEVESLTAVIDGDPYSQLFFNPGAGQFDIEFAEPRRVGRLSIDPGPVNGEQGYQLSVSRDGETFQDIESHSGVGISIHAFPTTPPSTKTLRLGNFTVENEGDYFVLGEMTMRGPRNPDTPSYVERMAYEMDRASGRFLAAWNQFQRYYQDAERVGDTISMNLALEKMHAIYNDRVHELLAQAVERYEEETGSLPSPRMQELVEGPYLRNVVQEQVEQDPAFAQEVLPVLLLPDGQLSDMLTTFNGEHPQLLITEELPDGEMDWSIVSRLSQIQRREAKMMQLNQFVQQFEREEGRPPNSLQEVTQQSWYNGGEFLLEDPLGGEFYYNAESGEVEARNAQY